MSEKNQKEMLHRLKNEPKRPNISVERVKRDSGNLQNSVDLERTHGDKRIIEHFMKHRSQEVKRKFDMGFE
jgi:hypothetical protein